MAEITLIQGTPEQVREHVGWDAITKLRFGYYYDTYPNIKESTVGRLVMRTNRESWDDPNLAEGQSRRARPLVVVAQNNTTRDLVASAYIADDVSKTQTGSLRFVPGAVQEQLKLHSSALIDKRWAWLREVTVSKEWPLLFPLIIKTALESKDTRQPVSVYPYAGEVALIGVLEDMKFAPDTNPDGTIAEEIVNPFGRHGPAITRHRFTLSTENHLAVAEASIPDEFKGVHVHDL